MSRGSRFAVLAVCTANICRSPLIEILLRARLDDRRFEVASAGVRGWDRQPMDPMAAAELTRLGHASDTFRSHPLDSYLVDSADLILTATREHRSEVLAASPQALRRTFTLLEFAALTELAEGDDPAALVAHAAQRRSLAPAQADVRDPYRRGADVHRATADQIDVAVATVAQRLNALVAAS
jgi:protein-tyrosine phosphatase